MFCNGRELFSEQVLSHNAPFSRREPKNVLCFSFVAELDGNGSKRKTIGSNAFN